MVMKYFPNNKGLTFSSKTYNPMASQHKAPNERLELSVKEHKDLLDSFDLSELLIYLGVIKRSVVSSSNRLANPSLCQLHDYL
jgi:hypothetical protein